jgi:hypothetical protein
MVELNEACVLPAVAVNLEARMARLLCCGILAACVATSAYAHHTIPGRSHPSVTLSQQVLADGKPLPAGTYELWITDERPDVGAGAPSDAQRIVELAQDGKVVARVIAEVFPRSSGEAVGTSGGTQAGGRARVERLSGGEFLRVSINDADGRYLIHLPTGPLGGPAPQPQTPSRVELPWPVLPTTPPPQQ